MDGEDLLSGVGGDVIEEGDASAEVMEKGSLSPLTGSYLLIVLAEPHSDEDREIILERLNKGLLSWDVDSSHVDLNCELLNLANSSPEGDEARNGEKLVQWASENLVVEVLIHSQVNTLQQCMKNLLASFTRHRHIIHSGYTFQGSGSWVLQDGTFSLNDYLELWGESDVQRILSAYKGDICVAVHCASENGWTQERLSKEPFAKMCQIQMNPTASEKMSQVHNAGVDSFIEYISKLLTPSPIKEILEPSDIVGNIRFSHPTLYVFPGGQGDAALFGINGFNMLIDGGFSRRSCFWDFTRHLDRLDAVLLTRVNNNSVGGLSSVIQRKVMNQVYPQIGHFFGNVLERKCGDKDREKGGNGDHPHGEKLLVSLTDEGQKMLDNLRNINLKPHLCFRETHIEPINLYHKVGHGKLDLYILNPAKDSREVKEFLSKWNSDCKSFVSSRISLRQQQQQQDGKDFQYPVLNLVSICALLVWQPANPKDPITRILFPGSTPQHKIFEALQKLKHLEFLKYPVCSAKTIAASNKSKVKSEKVISEARQQLSKVSSHANVMATGSSLQPSSTEGSLSRTAATTTAVPSALSKMTISTHTIISNSKNVEDKEKERATRAKSKIGIADSNKVQGAKTQEIPAAPKRQPRSSSKTGVGVGKTPSATRVPSKGPSSTRRSVPVDTTEKISSSIPKKVSPTSPAKKSIETTNASRIGHGLKSSSLSKTGIPGRGGTTAASIDSTPPPSTPPKAAKESANNRRVIEYKSHLTKSNVKTESQKTSNLKGSTGEIKKRISSTTGKSIPKSPPSSNPVAVKRSHKTAGIGAKEIIATTAAAAVIGGVAGEILTRKEKDQSPPVTPPASETPASLKIPEDGEEEEKKIQAETNGSIISSREENGVEEEEDKSQQQLLMHHEPQQEQEEPTSLPPLAPHFLPTESGSELSSLDHMSLPEEEMEHQQEQTSTAAVISSSTQDLSVGGEEQQPFDSLTLQDDGVVESEQDEEEDEYLIVEKDESTTDNVENALDNFERVQTQSKVSGSLDEIPTVTTDDGDAAIELDGTAEIPEEKDVDLLSKQEKQNSETDDEPPKKDEEQESLEDGAKELAAVEDVIIPKGVVDVDAEADSESHVEMNSKDEIGDKEKDNNLDIIINDEDKDDKKMGQVKEEIVAKSVADELESAIDDENRTSLEDSLVANKSVGDKEQEDDEGGVQSIVECSSVKNALERESNILELKESGSEQLEVGRCKKEEEEIEFSSLPKDERYDDIHQLKLVPDDEECEKVGKDESENIVKKNDANPPSTSSLEEFPGNNLAFQGEVDKVEEVVVQVQETEQEDNDKDLPPTSSHSLNVLEETQEKVQVDSENREDVTPLGLKETTVDAQDGKVEQEQEQILLTEKSPYDSHQELTQPDDDVDQKQEEKEHDEQAELKIIKYLEEQDECETKEDETRQIIKNLEQQTDDQFGIQTSGDGDIEQAVKHVEIESQSLIQNQIEQEFKTTSGTTDVHDVEVGIIFKEDSEESEKSKTAKGHEADNCEKDVSQIKLDSTVMEPEVKVHEVESKEQQEQVLFNDDVVEEVSKEKVGEKDVVVEQEQDFENLNKESTLRKASVDKVEKMLETTDDAHVKDLDKEVELEKYDEKVDHQPLSSFSLPQLDKQEEIRETVLQEDQRDVGQEDKEQEAESLNVDDIQEKDKLVLKKEIRHDQQGSRKSIELLETEGEKVSEKLEDAKVQRDNDKLDDTIIEQEKQPTALKHDTDEKLETTDDHILNLEQQSNIIVDKTIKDSQDYERKELQVETLDIELETKVGADGKKLADDNENNESVDISEGLGEDKFIHPLPYEETMESEGAIEKILMMKDRQDVKEGKSSLIDNEGGDGDKKKGKQRDDPVGPSGLEKVGGVSGIVSAIPKLPRESREVIRTPDEVAELPMHEEVEPGTYETDEVVDEHEPEKFIEEDPGVEAIGISNLPLAHTTTIPAVQQQPPPTTIDQSTPLDNEKKLSNVAVVEVEKIDKINISLETTSPPDMDTTHGAHAPAVTTVDGLTTENVVEKVEHVHQEIVLTSSSFDTTGGSEVKKCDAAVSPVLESLLGHSPPKIFPGQEIETAIITSEQMDQQHDDEENGNLDKKTEIEQTSSSALSIDKKINDDNEEADQLEGSIHVIPSTLSDAVVDKDKDKENSELVASSTCAVTKEIDDEDESRVNAAQDGRDTDKILTIGRDNTQDEELSGLEMKPITSVVITPSTPPVHKELDLEKSEFSYPAEMPGESKSNTTSQEIDKRKESDGDGDGDAVCVGESASPSEINDAVKLGQVVEADEKSKSQTLPTTVLLSGGEHERKLSDNSDESSTSSATPLTIFSTISSAPTDDLQEKQKSALDTIANAVEKDDRCKEIEGETKVLDEREIGVEVTHLPESIQVSSDERNAGIVREGITIKCADVEKLFLLPGKDDGDKSDVDDDDIYETDETPALGAIRSGLLTAATTLSAAVISQSPEHLATIPSFNESELVESIAAKSVTSETSIVTSKDDFINGKQTAITTDESKSKVSHESQIEEKTRDSSEIVLVESTAQPDDYNKVGIDNSDLQSGENLSTLQLHKDVSSDDNVQIVEVSTTVVETTSTSTTIGSRRSSGVLTDSVGGRVEVIEAKKESSSLDSGSVVDGSIRQTCSEKEEEEIVDETRVESNISCAHVELANKLVSVEQNETETQQTIVHGLDEKPEEILHENIERCPTQLPSSSSTRVVGDQDEDIETQEQEEKRDEEKPIVLPLSTAASSSSSSSVLPTTSQSTPSSKPQEQDNIIADGQDGQDTQQIEIKCGTAALDQGVGESQSQQGNQGLDIDKQIKSLTGSGQVGVAHEHELSTESIVTSKVSSGLETVERTSEDENVATTPHQENEAITKEDIIKRDKSIEDLDTYGDASDIIVETVEENIKAMDSAVKRDSQHDFSPLSTVISHPEMSDSTQEEIVSQHQDQVTETCDVDNNQDDDGEEKISQLVQAQKVVSSVIEAADRKVEEETKVAQEILLQVEEKLMTVSSKATTTLSSSISSSSPSPSPVILDKECTEKCDKEKVLSETCKEKEIVENISTVTPHHEPSTLLGDDAVVIVGVDASVVKPPSKDDEKDEGASSHVGKVEQVNNLVSERVGVVTEESEKVDAKQDKDSVESAKENVERDLRQEKECVEEKAEEESSEKSIVSTSLVETFETFQPPPSTSLTDVNTSGRSSRQNSSTNISAVETNGRQTFVESNLEPPLTSQFNLGQSEQNKSILLCASPPSSTDADVDAGAGAGAGVASQQDENKDSLYLQSMEISKDSNAKLSLVHEGQDDEAEAEGKERQEISQSLVTNASDKVTPMVTKAIQDLSDNTFSLTQVESDSVDDDDKEPMAIISETLSSSTDDTKKEQGNKICTDLNNLKKLEIEEKICSQEMDSESSRDNQLEMEKSILESTLSIEPQSKESTSLSEQSERVTELKIENVTVRESLFDDLKDLSSSRQQETSHSSVYQTLETTTSQLINLTEKSNIEQVSVSSSSSDATQSTASLNTIETLASSKILSNGHESTDVATVKDEIEQQYNRKSSKVEEDLKSLGAEVEVLRKSSSEFTTAQDTSSTFMTSSNFEEKIGQQKESSGEDEEEKFLEKSLLSSMQEDEDLSQSKKSDVSVIVKKTDGGGSKTTITRRFSSQEMEAGIVESVKSFESKRRASEIIEHSEEISGSSSSRAGGESVAISTYPSASSCSVECSGMDKQFVEIVEKDNDMGTTKTSPGSSFYGGYGYVFGSAAEDEVEENPEDEESIYGGGEDSQSQSQSLSTRDSNQSIIISTDVIPTSSTTATTTTTTTTQSQENVVKQGETIAMDKDDDKIQREQDSHFDETMATTTSTKVGQDKTEFILGETKSSTSHLTMSYDLMEEGSYSSGDFSDSQLSTVAGREQSGLDDDNVHNYSYERVVYSQEEEDDQTKLPVSSSQDLENGNLPCTTVNSGDMTTTTSFIIGPTGTTLATTMTTQSSTILTKFETTNNGNTTTSTTTTTDIQSGQGGSRTSVTEGSSIFSTSTSTLPSSSSRDRQKESEGEDIVKTWGKPLGLPPIHTEDQPQSGNFNETTTTTGAGADANLSKGTPKKDKSVDRKNPATPGKTTHGSSTSRGRSHHRSTKNISPIYVDLAYVPHHGNSNYCDSEFFRLIRSRYYVFSGLEPSRQVFEGLLHGKQNWEDKNLEVTIIPTYDTDTLGYWVVDSEDSLSDARIDLAPSAARCTINLQDHETSCSAYRLEF